MEEKDIKTLIKTQMPGWRIVFVREIRGVWTARLECSGATRIVDVKNGIVKTVSG